MVLVLSRMLTIGGAEEEELDAIWRAEEELDATACAEELEEAI